MGRFLSLQKGSKIWVAKSRMQKNRLLLLFLNNNDPVFLHPAFWNPCFGPFFLQGHKPTHVFKTRILGADWLGKSLQKLHTIILANLSDVAKTKMWDIFSSTLDMYFVIVCQFLPRLFTSKVLRVTLLLLFFFLLWTMMKKKCWNHVCLDQLDQIGLEKHDIGMVLKKMTWSRKAWHGLFKHYMVLTKRSWSWHGLNFILNISTYNLMAGLSIK